MTWVYVIIPIDEVIFFRGVALAHQPVNHPWIIKQLWVLNGQNKDEKMDEKMKTINPLMMVIDGH